MAPPARRLTLLIFLVAALLAALPALAQASPDGDDDPTYNAGSAFGTQYSLIDGESSLGGARPVTDHETTGGSSVTAAVVRTGETSQSIRLTRFNTNGQPAGFGGDGISVQAIPVNDHSITELLDIRILSRRHVLGPGAGLPESFGEGQGDILLRYHFDVDGVLQTDDVASKLPVPCQPDMQNGSGIQEVTQYVGAVVAARVKANGDVAALWDCIPQHDYSSRAVEYCEDNWVFVTSYGPADVVETAARKLPETVSYGNDLELGPTGDPYALVGICPPEIIPLVGVDGSSQVFHVNADATLTLADPAAGSEELDGLPVDLAVDSQARPVVWTEDVNPVLPADGNNHWIVWRLKALDLTLDTSWGDAGKATITDPRLAFATGGGGPEVKVNFLTVRPDNKVLATGRNDDGSTNGIIAGLTNGGDTDTGFATSGFKEFEYSANNEFLRIGEPTLQSDGKVLVPHTSGGGFEERTALRIAPPPDPEEEQYVGVTRLRGPGGGGGGGGPPPPDDVPSNPDTGSTPSNPTSEPPSLVTPSATAPAICGRRAISLVRADVRRKTVKLTGLVGSALFGKRVTIQTDPKGARSSAFTTTTTVTASSTGAFTATVDRPKRSDFVSVRYRARSGGATSKSLKLPQRLTSRSVKSAKNTITVEGRVKKSVLGRRNNVIIRRLICGRYRRVGSARPDRDGNYTVTFPVTTSSDEVAFYRAEARVLRRRGSKVYVIQYARAIVIRTTGQTG